MGVIGALVIGPVQGGGMTLAELVVWSLTGERIAVSGGFDPVGVAQRILDLGWDTQRLQDARDQALARGQVWPRFVPANDRPGIGAAQLDAATRAVLQNLGVGPHARVRRSGKPDARDRALMADRPPHHGTVG